MVLSMQSRFRERGFRVFILLALLTRTQSEQQVSLDPFQPTCESPLVLAEPERLVAIGDIHGDLSKLIESLELAKVWDHTREEWIGERTIVVQMGDQVDRGDDELEVTALLRKVAAKAQAEGGALHVLVGNHEIMSAQGDLRYVTQGAMQRFDQWNRTCAEQESLGASATEQDNCDLWEQLSCPDNDLSCRLQLEKLPEMARSRFLAMRAGGPIAKNVWAKERHTLMIIGDSLFVHGGIMLEHVSGGCEKLDVLDGSVRDWMEGKQDMATAQRFWEPRVGSRWQSAPLVPAEYSLPDIAQDQHGPFWNRVFALPTSSLYDGSIGPDKCALLDDTLAALPVAGVKRMVVGHTVQTSGAIVEDCGQRGSGASVFKIDVGMSSKMYNKPPQVLEILQGGVVNVLKHSRQELEMAAPLLL